MILSRHPVSRLVPVLFALGLGGCAQYSSVTEKRPSYMYKPYTPVGTLIAQGLESRPSRSPEARLGLYLDAASAASRDLAANPRDAAAERDYNFAVGRVFELVHDFHLEPWKAPIIAPGAAGPWEFVFPPDPRPGRNPADYHILPADRYKFKGTYVGVRSVKEGLGAPLIVYSKPDKDFTRTDKFAQGKHTYYGITGFLRFEGRRCTLTYADPLSTETIKFAGHTFPLAGDFTAPIALALARENPKKLEILRLLRPGNYAESARLARLQPYDPTKIPIICVHGLLDSQATWTPMITSLRADPEIRANYQFWFYSYPSGYPYPYSSAIMRRQLDEMNATYPGHKKLVLIGHSMGGIISRSMITDSGMTLWNAHFRQPPAKTGFTASSRRMLTDTMIFTHRPEVGRVIFIAAPHRGSTLATNWIGRLGTRLVHAPTSILKIVQEAGSVATLNTSGVTMGRMPTSIETLSPENRFVKAINTIPATNAGIPFNSIMGDRGKGGNLDKTPPISTDGIVPYWSSHLDGAQSELIVPSGHSAHQNPQAIEEVRRILKAHAKTTK